MEPLSVVVPTHQRADRLRRVLAPLLADDAVAELVVVVDGSTDGSLALLQELAREDPRVRPLWQENAGAGAARQRGVEAATCDVVLLLDDDVLADPGLATGHARAQAEEPGTVVIGRMPTPPLHRRRPHDVTTVRYATDYARACNDYVAEPSQVLEQFWSGNVSMPREVALTVDLRDPSRADLYPFEDRELGLRLRQAGVRAVFRPELTATHLHVRPLPRFLQDSRRQGAAMQVLHRRYPDDVPEPTGAWLAGRVPVPFRWCITGARRSERVARVVGPALGLAVTALGHLRWWWAQDVALVVLQRTAQAWGAHSWEAGA